MILDHSKKIPGQENLDNDLRNISERQESSRKVSENERNSSGVFHDPLDVSGIQSRYMEGMDQYDFVLETLVNLYIVFLQDNLILFLK